METIGEIYLHCFLLDLGVLGSERVLERAKYGGNIGFFQNGHVAVQETSRQPVSVENELGGVLLAAYLRRMWAARCKKAPRADR
jgi:hypothetical protein